jgi:hypothetical protein
MNENAIKLVFADWENAMIERDTTKWEPYTRAAELLEECKANNILLNPSKRSRKNDFENNSNQKSNNQNTKINKEKVDQQIIQSNTILNTNTQLPTTNAWSTPILGNINSSVTSTSHTTTPDSTVTTMSHSADEMEEFKSSTREEIEASEARVRDEMKKDIERVRISTHNSITNLDQQIQSSNKNMESKMTLISKNTDESIAKLESNIKTQNNEVQQQIIELKQHTGKNHESTSDQFDDIKSMLSQIMLSQIMLGTSSGISKRIKTMTAVKRRTTNPTVMEFANSGKSGSPPGDFPFIIIRERKKILFPI